MNAKLVARFALAGALLFISGPALAHHGAATYDSDKLSTLKGTVTDFRFQNPHTEIFLNVKDASGKVQTWILELVSATTLSRTGWSKSIIKSGDQITVAGNLSKNGSNTMRLAKVTLASGKELPMERGEDYAGQ
jgi:hypothetical protein